MRHFKVIDIINSEDTIFNFTDWSEEIKQYKAKTGAIVCAEIKFTDRGNIIIQDNMKHIIKATTTLSVWNKSIVGNGIFTCYNNNDDPCNVGDLLDDYAEIRRSDWIGETT